MNKYQVPSVKCQVFCALVIILVGMVLLAREASAAVPCSGKPYDGHPALVVECLHQLSISGGHDPYPGPAGTPEPYPGPVMWTPGPTATREPIPTYPPPED